MSYVNYSDFDKEINKAISVFADAARDDAALIISSGITTSDARITDAGEGYTGVIRWLEYMDNSTPGVPSAGATLNPVLGTSEYLSAEDLVETYIKNVGVVAARENSIQSLLSKVDGLAFLGRQFGAVRARREDATLRSVLQGIGNLTINGYTEVTSAEAAQLVKGGTKTAAAGNTVSDYFGYITAYLADNDPNTAGAQAGYQQLFVNENTQNNRSSFFDVLLDAMTAVSGEFEEPFYYLVVTPETFNILRKQNVLDVNPVQDGNLNINTLLGGKVRLIVSGNVLSAGLSNSSTLKVSYLLKAGAFHYSNVAINNPVAMDTNVVTNKGFGDVSIVSRWGNIIHPRGYSVAGTIGGFRSDSDLTANTAWSQVAKNVNQTGIFPIFHG